MIIKDFAKTGYINKETSNCRKFVWTTIFHLLYRHNVWKGYQIEDVYLQWITLQT